MAGGSIQQSVLSLAQLAGAWECFLPVLILIKPRFLDASQCALNFTHGEQYKIQNTLQMPTEDPFEDVALNILDFSTLSSANLVNHSSQDVVTETQPIALPL